jgi:hypothetical protein
VEILIAAAILVVVLGFGWIGCKLFCVGGGYVPFKVLLPEAATCDVGDPAKQTDLDYLIIENETDASVFVVHSIVFAPAGIDELDEGLLVRSVIIDGRVRAVPVTESMVSINGGAVDFLGALTKTTGGSFMRQIVSDGTSSTQPDIKLTFTCQAQLTGSMDFPVGSIEVSGWKRASDTISIRYSETGS